MRRIRPIATRSVLALALSFVAAPGEVRAAPAVADTAGILPGEVHAAPAVADTAATAPDSLVAATLPPARVRAWQTGLLRPDRLEHASLSLTLALGVGALSKEPAAGAGAAVAIGLAKEVRDARHGGFDPVDLLADVVGAALGAWAAEALTR